MADGPFTFVGEHYRITGLEGMPKPVQRPHPPIVVGGGGKKVLSLAAREADRWFGLPDANARQKLRLLQLCFAAALVILRYRPDVVVTTGAAPGLIFLFASGIYLAWSLGGLNADIDIGFTRRWPIWRG